MTLIELLISLAIIGIMTGIAFPVFSVYQKKSAVDSDMRNFISLFNYARALQNNPDNFSRTTDPNQVYKYQIKIINDSSGRRAELYSVADASTIIDKVDFSENIMVNYQNNTTDNGSGLTLTFTGLPPSEVLNCSTICDQKIEIGLSTAGRSPIIKKALILNTNNTLHQLLSINLE